MPRASTDRQDRYLRNLALGNRHSTARGLRNDLQLATGDRVSNQTVRNRLHRDSFHARRPANRSSAHRQANFCSEPHRMAIGPVAHSTDYRRKPFPCMHV